MINIDKLQKIWKHGPVHLLPHDVAECQLEPEKKIHGRDIPPAARLAWWRNQQRLPDSIFPWMSLELHENPPFALQVSLIKSLASIMQPRMGCSYQRRESMRINLASSFNHSSQWQRQRMLRDAKVYHKFNPNFTTTQHPKQKFPHLWLGGCTSAHQPWLGIHGKRELSLDPRKKTDQHVVNLDDQKLFYRP